MKKFILILFLSLGMLAFFSCDSDESKNARLEVWLTDAPGDFEEVKVDIQGVEIHTSAGNEDSGWKPLSVQKGIYDLLTLTNGLDTLLGSLELPAGRISQIRLVLGNSNTVKVAGEVHSLQTPSAQQSGLKLQVKESLTEGLTYRILLDFDVARSVVETGNGSYSLKPVIRTITEAQDGAIRGVVDPVEATPAIYAIVGSDTVATTFTDAAGEFLLRGLPADSYSVVFVPNSTYATVTKEGVSVSLGNVTDLGTVAIPAQE